MLQLIKDYETDLQDSYSLKLDNQVAANIFIDKDGNLTIRNALRVLIKSDDIDFDGRNINFHASESLNIDVDGSVYIGSSDIITQQARKLYLNPQKGTSGYRGKFIGKVIGNSDAIQSSQGYRSKSVRCCNHSK